MKQNNWTMVVSRTPCEQKGWLKYGLAANMTVGATKSCKLDVDDLRLLPMKVISELRISFKLCMPDASPFFSRPASTAAFLNFFFNSSRKQ
jgi:hypothetical protein